MNHVTRIPNFQRLNSIPSYPKTLSFIDEHFKDTPIGEIDSKAINYNILELCKDAKDTSTCTYYANIAHEFDSTHDVIGEILIIGLSKCKEYSDKVHLFKVAAELNRSYLFNNAKPIDYSNE